MTLRVFTVAGMRCSHCAEIVERNLRRLPGVRGVRVTPLGGRVEIDAADRLVSDAVLAMVIRDAGFHPRPADPGHRHDPGPPPGGPVPG